MPEKRCFVSAATLDVSNRKVPGTVAQRIELWEAGAGGGEVAQTRLRKSGMKGERGGRREAL